MADEAQVPAWAQEKQDVPAWAQDTPTPAPAPAKPVYPTDQASLALLGQSSAGSMVNAAQGNWFTRPFQAAGEAVKNATINQGALGLSADTVKDLQDHGILDDFNSKHFSWRNDVLGAIIAPAAVATDAAMRGVNAAVSGTVALGAGVINELPAWAKGGYGKEGPEEVARNAQEFTNSLYLAAGLPEFGVGVPRAEKPTLRETLSIPKVEEMPKKAAEVESGAIPTAPAPTPAPVAPAGPTLKAPIKNPILDEKSGNLNLNYIKTSDDVLSIQARAAQAIADRDGVVITNEVTKARGQELVDRALSETADGIPPELSNRMRGDPVDEAQLYAARVLTAQAGEEVFKLSEIARKTNDPRDYAELENGYDRLMTITGIRHDISATFGRGTQSHQIIIGGEEAATKIAGMSKEDAMRTMMSLPDAQSVAKALQTMKKPGWSDMAIFHYVSWLLSNPVTHAAYAAFGEVQTALRQIEQTVSVGVGTVQRAVGAGFGAKEFKALQTEREGIESRLAAADAGKIKIKASESGQMELRLKEIIEKQKMGETRMPEEIAGRLYGVGKGQVDGLRAAGRSLTSGGVQMFPGEEAAAREAAKKAEDAALAEGKSAEDARTAGTKAYNDAAVKISNPIMERAQFIKNPLFKALVKNYGRIIGVSPTIASSIHTFQKFSAYTESLYATAYRRAALMGEATDAEMSARIAKLIANPTEDMMKQAAEDGKYASLVNRPGGLGQGIENLAHTNAWTRFVIPFARIANNLTSQSFLERTPAGLFPTTRVAARIMGKEGAIAQSDAIARMAVGTSIVTAGAWLASNGIVNGVGPTKPSERAFSYMIGKPPMTVRIGDVNVPLRLLGLPGRIISMGAATHDIFQGHKEGDDAWDMAGHAIQVVAETALQENALKGLSDLLDAVVGHDAEMSKRYALNAVATAIVPRGVAQWTRLEDPYMRSTMGNGFYDRLQKTVDAQLPWKSQGLLPQVDVYGRDMVRGGDYEAAMKDPVTQAEIRANQLPTRLQPRINNVKLTDAQYYAYQKAAGAAYYQAMSSMVSDPSFADLPIGTQADMIHTTMTNARAMARQSMMLNDPELANSVAEYGRKLMARRLGE